MMANRRQSTGVSTAGAGHAGVSSYRLDLIASVQQGYTFSPDHQGQTQGKWLYVKVGDLNAHGNSKYMWRTTNYISDDVLAEMRATPFLAGSIVFPRVGAALRNNNKRILQQDCLTDDNVIVVTVRDPNICCAEYLYYWFDYHDLQQFCNDGTVPVINGKNLKQQKVPLPDIEAQKRTASMLSAWDTAIEKTEQLIAAKEDRFLALIDRLVLKPASGKAWKTQKLRDIATRVQRRSDGGGHPVLTISNAFGFVLQEEKYKRYMAGESVKDYILLRRGEFAYNKGNSLRFQFGCVYQLHTYDEAIVPHVYVSFRLHDDISSSYMRHLFAVDYLKPQLGKLVKTGIRNNGLLNIRPDEFLGVTVPIPPLEKQHRIAEILDAARSEIDLLKRQADAYRTQKRGLMQKLLTGQWRVNVPEEANK